MRLAVCLVAVVAALGVPAAHASVPGTAQTASLLRGIPQHGAWLGESKAPIVIVEYVDLQCPYCKVFSTETLPGLIRQYVRTGRARILFRGLAFVGPDSKTALRWTYAAGKQNKLWNVLELLYANQGTENHGWVTTPLLTSVARSVPGLDLARLRRDVSHTATDMAAAAAAAQRAKVPGTPYLEAGRSLSTLRTLQLRSFDVKDLASQLDAL